jgi:predicted O-methyltransferase YrrM
VLEIGFRYGGTSHIILCALEDRGTPGRLVSIDRQPEPAVDLAPFAHRFHLLHGSSPAAIPEAVRLLGGPIEFCFVDGDHSYRGVTADLEGVGPEMSHDGYILLHDAFRPEVRRAIQHFVGAHPKRIVDCGPIAPWPNAEGWGGMHLLRTVGDPSPRRRRKETDDGGR